MNSRSIGEHRQVEWPTPAHEAEETSSPRFEEAFRQVFDPHEDGATLRIAGATPPPASGSSANRNPATTTAPRKAPDRRPNGAAVPNAFPQGPAIAPPMITVPALADPTSGATTPRPRDVELPAFDWSRSAGRELASPMETALRHAAEGNAASTAAVTAQPDPAAPTTTAAGAAAPATTAPVAAAPATTAPGTTPGTASGGAPSSDENVTAPAASTANAATASDAQPAHPDDDEPVHAAPIAASAAKPATPPVDINSVAPPLGAHTTPLPAALFVPAGPDSAARPLPAAAAPAPAPLPSVAEVAAAHEIAAAAAAAVDDGPAPHGHLGHTRAELVVGEGADRVVLRVSASQHHVRVEALTASPELASALRQSQGELRDALARQGLQLGDLAAGSHDGHRAPSGHPNESQPSSAAPSDAPSTETTDEPATAPGVRVVA